MAVYTRIDDDMLRQALARFDIGALVACEGIADGVENTNYRLTTDKGRFILTLFERRVNAGELPFYIGYMAHLRQRGIPCPAAAMDRDGNAVFTLAGKPAMITTFLEGSWPQDISGTHCAAVGDMLAQMHLAAKSFAMTRHNAMALPAWRSLVHACRDRADTVEKGLFAFLDAEIDTLEKNWPRYLPRAVVHADLFPDNVFFKDEMLTGVIDFYFACQEQMAYDLMLTLNPWCFSPDGSFFKTRAAVLFRAYQARRSLTRGEIKALPLLGRAAAMRIVATRLYDWLNPAEGALVRPKDPMEHVRILRFHRSVAGPEDYGIDL